MNAKSQVPGLKSQVASANPEYSRVLSGFAARCAESLRLSARRTTVQLPDTPEGSAFRSVREKKNRKNRRKGKAFPHSGRQSRSWNRALHE